MEETYWDTFVRAVEHAGDTRGILGDDELVFPPRRVYGYEATPRNALTFGAMGVDGVHYTILELDGAVTDDSPVIHVSPMDFTEPYAVLGESLLDYLAGACAVTVEEMETVFEAERAQGERLVPFLKDRFVHSRLYDDARLRRLERLLKLVDAQP